jgi:hypothetical protein
MYRPAEATIAVLANLLRPGFAKPVGTGPVRPVSGGTGLARYMNSKPYLKFLLISKPAGLTGLPAGFY